MESFLNGLWLIIAVAALATWRFSWARQARQQPRGSVQQWTAFSCALVLLFFTVSLTDDLHCDLALFDDCATGQRHSLAHVGANHSPSRARDHFSTSGSAVVSALHSQPSLLIVATLVPHSIAGESSGVASRLAARAPPTPLS